MSPNLEYVGLLMFLAMVGKTEDSLVKGYCSWACEIVNAHPWGTVFSNTRHLRAKFLLNKRVEQECARFTNEANTSEWIKVWIYTKQEASIASSNDFSLLTSAILSNLPLFPFSLDHWEQDGNISCVCRQKSGQTSNESNGTANGLEALYSPYFYITKEASNFSKNFKPFLSYIWSENIFTVSASFTERDETATNIQFFQQFEGLQYTTVSILRHVLWIFCTLYSTYFLTLFLPNISTKEISEVPVTAIHPESESENDGMSLVEVEAKPSRQPQPTEQDYFVKDWLDQNPVNSGSLDDFDDYSEVDSIIQSLPETEGSGGFNTNRNAGHTVEPSGLQHSILQMESTVSKAEAVTSFKHHVSNRQNSERNKSVYVIHFGGGPSPVGLRSFVATKLLRYKLINFAFMFTAPVFIFLLVDIAFVLLPGLVLKVATPSLPSASMTKSVLLFVYEYPYSLMLLFFYCFRILGLCIFQSLENIDCVPCFSCRKHLLCFIGRNYVTQFIPLNCLQFTVCDECKKVHCSKQCEFHVFSNIKYHVDSQPDILEKNWKDVKDAFHHMFSRFCSQSNDDSKKCWVLKTFIIYVVLFIPFLIFFLILCVLDFGLSCPIISFCYGRVWFSSQWFEGKRSKQFWCLFLEFIFIFFSIVWAIYLSVCCSKALVVAVTSLFIAGVNYPLETVSTYAIITLFWVILWDQYSAFTERYAKLDKMISTICTKNHPMRLKQYQLQKGDGHTYFPKDLVDFVHRKVIPLSKSVRELIVTLLISVGGLIFMVLVSTSTKVPNSKVLPAVSSFMLLIQLLLHRYSNGREKKNDCKDQDLKEAVKQHVAAYFEGKVD